MDERRINDMLTYHANTVPLLFSFRTKESTRDSGGSHAGDDDIFALGYKVSYVPRLIPNTVLSCPTFNRLRLVRCRWYSNQRHSVLGKVAPGSVWVRLSTR